MWVGQHKTGVDERERSLEDEKAEHERPDDGTGHTREPRDPDRLSRVAPEVVTGSQGEPDTGRRDFDRLPQAFNLAAENDRQRDVEPSQ